LNWNKLIRESHRWLSIAFTLGVITYMVAMSVRPGEQPPAWMGFLALFPLIFLFFSGLYLFVLPYLGRGRITRRAE